MIPIVILNKLIQRFIPDADDEKSSIEIVIEILLQLIVRFCGIVIIHRIITYIPTYSGFKYENLVLTNVILAFLVIVLSIQTKLGIKVNILFDRLMELWNGPNYDNNEGKAAVRNGVRVSKPISQHAPSQADYLENTGVQGGMFPPAPVVSSRGPTGNGTYDNMMRGQPVMEQPVMPANFSGSVFGSAF